MQSTRSAADLDMTTNGNGHAPSGATNNTKCFQGFSFSSTGLPSATRTHLESLVAHLGGQATRTMSSATTHLLVPNAFAQLPDDGARLVPPTSAPKLLGALKWNACVVVSQWVVDVAQGLASVDSTLGYSLPWWNTSGANDDGRVVAEHKVALRRVLESLGSDDPPEPCPAPPPRVQQQQQQQQQQHQQDHAPVVPTRVTDPPVKRTRSNRSLTASNRSKFRVVSSDDSGSTTDDGSDPSPNDTDDTPKPAPLPDSANVPLVSHLFEGYALAADGFPAARLARLQHLVHQHAGTYLATLPITPEGRAQFPHVRHWVLVLPTVLSPALVKTKARCPDDVLVGSENWLQHCLLDQCIHPLSSSFLFHPYLLPPLPALANHTICLSGFSEPDQAALESLLSALGATLSPSLHRACTLLLYASATAPHAPSSKFDKAMVWNIPVVPSAWLHHVIATRAYARPDRFRVRPAHLVFDGLVVFVTARGRALPEAGGVASSAGGGVPGVIEVHGGKVVFAWTASVTHVVHVAGAHALEALAGEAGADAAPPATRKMSGAGLSGASEGEREVKLAKAQGKWVVSPWWVADSVRAKHRLPEVNYPPNYDPARQLQLVQQPLEVVRRPSSRTSGGVAMSSSTWTTPHGLAPATALPATSASTTKSKRLRRTYDPDVVIVAAADGSQIPMYSPEESSVRKRAKVVSVPPGVAPPALWSMSHETPSRPPRSITRPSADPPPPVDPPPTPPGHDMDVDPAFPDVDATARPPPLVVEHDQSGRASPPPHRDTMPVPHAPPSIHPASPIRPPSPPAPPAVDPVAQALQRKQAQMAADLELLLADLPSVPTAGAHTPAAPSPPPPLRSPSPTRAPPLPGASDALINLSAIYTQPGGAARAASPDKPIVTYDDPEGARARKKVMAATATATGAVPRVVERARESLTSGPIGRHWAALARVPLPPEPAGLERSESESSVVRRMVEDASLGGGSSTGEVDMAEASAETASVGLQQQDGGELVTDETALSPLGVPQGGGATSQLPNALLAPSLPTGRPRPALAHAPRIALSGCTADRDMYEGMIAALGGHLMANAASSSSWVLGTTHLVISVPISCEKCMCAIASGAWLLRPSYVEASYRAGHWVPEAEHAWAALPREGDMRRAHVVEAGQRAAVERLDVAKSLDLISGWERVFRSIHGAAAGAAGAGGGAFRGWRALLVGNANTSSYRNLLMAGGASIVPADGWDPDKDPDAVTHVLVQSNRLDPQLAANDIVRSKTYSATLIIQSLMGDRPPTPVLLRRMSSRSLGSSSATSSATGSTATPASATGTVAARETRRLASAAHFRQHQVRVQSTEAASTGSTAY